jgi:hypothetical protein
MVTRKTVASKIYPILALNFFFAYGMYIFRVLAKETRSARFARYTRNNLKTTEFF